MSVCISQNNGLGKYKTKTLYLQISDSDYRLEY